jgi:hypothetical protein
MLARNVEEYKLIREEMTSLKNCITTYIGFVFAGSGAMIYALTSVDMDKPESVCVALVASALFSVLVSMILFFLFYKFHSHNRYAGFCRLLSHEQDYSNNGNTCALFSWETNVSLLRRHESGCASLEGLLGKISVSGVTRTALRLALRRHYGINGRLPRVDKFRATRGTRMLCDAILLRSIGTDSWKFPSFVACLFFFMFLVFFTISVFLAVRACYWGIIWLLVPLCPISVIQLYLWKYICARLYSLTSGSTTIMSFYLKFIPLRVKFLNDQQQRIVPTYDGLDDDIWWRPCR